jgi:OOP family OmpA-OmpF porin
MTNLLGGFAACVIVFSIALPSAAASDMDIYVEYGGGVSFVPNQDLDGAGASGSDLNGEAESDPGFHVGAAIGKRFNEHFRAELGLSYRQNEVTNMSLRNEHDNAEGHIGLLAIMANGYFDWDLGIGVIPYLGAGIGWGSLEIDSKNNGASFAPNQQSMIEGQDQVFTYSIMAGGTYPINESLDLSLGYRYIATTEADINTNLSDPNPDPNLPDPNNPDQGASRINSSRRLDAEFDSHEIVLGLRINF